MAEPRPQILVVEDEPALATLLTYNLEQAGFAVTSTGDGEEAMVLLREQRPALALLDWMLPNLSGLEICRQIRRDRNLVDLPVIMLTARGEESDRVRGLDIGADDYMVKPFSPAELVARVRALLRRSQPGRHQQALQHGDLIMDLAAHRVRYQDRDVHLGPTEFRLLRHLLAHPGRVFSRQQLLDAVWDHASQIEIRTVDVHIRRLRQALCADGLPDPIRTVRATGYALAELVDR